MADQSESRPLLDNEEGSTGEDAYDKATTVSYLTYGWLNPCVNTGVQRQVNIKDTPRLALPEDTLANARRLLDLLDEEERSKRTHPLLRATVRSYWPQLVTMQCLNIAGFLLGLVSPFILQRVLVFQEAQEGKKHLSSMVVTEGFIAVAGLVVFGVFMMFFNSQVSFFQTRLNLRIAAAIRGAVVSRGVDGRSSPMDVNSAEASAGNDARVYNVISFDTGDSINIIWVVMGVWLFPFQLTAALIALFSQVAWAFVPGLIVIILAKTFCFWMAYNDGIYRDKLFAAKDIRLGCCYEGFTNVRTLQMLAWIPEYEQRIMTARSEELRLQRSRLWFQKIPAALDYSLSVIVTLTTLGFYVTYTNSDLKASVALPVIGLINALIGPFGNFPSWMNTYLVWKSAYARVNRFMGIGQQQCLHQGGDLRRSPDDSQTLPDTAVVSLQGCCFSFPSNCTSTSSGEDDAEAAIRQPLLGQENGFQLRDITLNVSSGEIVVVTGKEGQGKSALLLALLGEMQLESGSMRRSAFETATEDSKLPSSVDDAVQLLEGEAPRLGPSIPFAAQEVTLFAETVRSNIVFGSRFDQDIFSKVIAACALDLDLATMPAADLTEIASGGSTLSGGQKARVGLARAVYSALIAKEDRRDLYPLVLLDDPFCALDSTVTLQICSALFSLNGGLLRHCAVVIASAEPWWVASLPESHLCAAAVRGGRIVGSAKLHELNDSPIEELKSLLKVIPVAKEPSPVSARESQRNPQDEEEEQDPQEDEEENEVPQDDGHRLRFRGNASIEKQKQALEVQTQTELTEEQCMKGHLIDAEGREAGHVKMSTYSLYLDAVGKDMFLVLVISLVGIMVFQNFCNLWLAYWTSDKKKETFMYGWMKSWQIQPPEKPNQLLLVYACFVFAFTISNFVGHSLEIIGGVRAARKIFTGALNGTLARPFKWWDTNPTGRVLNRFSSDVEVMDHAVTNIMGVIIGAVLYFFGHTLVLTFSSPISVLLLPLVAISMEYFAQYYRLTIREVQRVYLVSMSSVYAQMTEAVLGRVTLRAFGTKQLVLSRCLLNLDDLQRASFAKSALGLWVGLRLGFAGFLLNTFNQLYPVLQYYGVLSPRSAAMVGFSISYSSEVVAIIQQFIMNFSDMEMQLVSIERLGEYSNAKDSDASISNMYDARRSSVIASGLRLTNVEVTYREGLNAALSNVNIDFESGQATAIMGRTGAGKTSLLLSIMQLVPYKGLMQVDGQVLTDLEPEEVRRRLVAVVPQQPVVFAGTLRWNLTGGLEYDDKQIWEALRDVGLESVVASTELGLDARLVTSTDASMASMSGVISLSLGQRQLLCAARALLRSPRVALLDEVTAALPQEVAISTATTLVKRFTSTGATVLLVTHQDELLSICDRVISISAGRIVSDRRL